MQEEKKGGFCEVCNKRVVVFRKGINHLLHLILTILTSGFWLIVWIALVVRVGGWRCSECGSTKIRQVK